MNVDGALSGIRVLDMADEKASYCSKILADMGARVIKVEKPEGDPSRRIGPFYRDVPNPERSLFFWYNNTNKYGITLNLEKATGRQIFMKLLENTDILVETSPPGYLQELGLGFETLRRKNHGLIQASVTGFGQSGPRSAYQSCDLVASATGGQMYVSGSPMTSPLKPHGESSYYLASLFAAISILLALRMRRIKGQGEHIDISLQEAVTSTLDHVMARYLGEKVVARRQGNRNWNGSFYLLPCRDGFILLPPFLYWETLVAWLDSEGMAEDLKKERWSEEVFRLSHREHIIEVLQKWTKTHTRGELFELGQLMRFPMAPVNSLKEAMDNPQLKAREFLVPVDHPEHETTLTYVGPPYKSYFSSSERWKRAPLTGEDNVQVYLKELGLSDKELEELSSTNVI